MLDGEGGYTVFGRLTPAETSLAHGYLPLGLAHQVRLVRPVAKDALHHLVGRRDGRDGPCAAAPRAGGDAYPGRTPARVTDTPTSPCGTGEPWLPARTLK
ncbi:hypothetical protein BRADO5856 [Bradyrhizobium sp. ORS 278]|nr:hypothetical protein BRADO5856 [Bradyrhizobium sp. ORS 278]